MKTYSAPETFGKSFHLDKADIWSLGATFLRLVTQKKYCSEDSTKEQLKEEAVKISTSVKSFVANIIADNNGKSDWNEEKSQELCLAADLMSKMMDLDPRRRPSIKNLYRHEFFKKVKEEPENKDLLDALPCTPNR